MQMKRFRENNLGIFGWLWAGNYRLERYLYTLHRITGLGLILFGIFHLTVTTVFRIQGKNVWDSAMSFLDNPIFKIGEFLVLIAFSFHALNGLRLIIHEIGFALGKPVPPIYPYTDAIRRNRALTLILMVIAMLMIVAFITNSVLGGWK
jgi:succinate dehydrogenase / fumarate reductase cytochrome b subunit